MHTNIELQWVKPPKVRLDPQLLLSLDWGSASVSELEICYLYDIGVQPSIVFDHQLNVIDADIYLVDTKNYQRTDKNISPT